jgi:RNA polymerase sigma factor (sigma-70 family)
MHRDRGGDASCNDVVDSSVLGMGDCRRGLVLLEDLFRTHERMLWGLSYRLTGCAADADDIVQDTFLRATGRRRPASDPTWRPWLVRVALNLGLDLLRRRKRRGGYEGPWLPSPIETGLEDVTSGGQALDTPEARYERLESVSFAFLLALEALTPKQRAVLLLRDVFDYSAGETGAALAMTQENVRITHHRARRAMRAYDQDRCVPTKARQEQVRHTLEQLLGCLINQDTAGFEALLAESARAVTDGGGEYTALAETLVGRAKVAVLHLRVARRRAGGARIELRLLNGLPAVVIEYASAVRRQAPRAVLRCEIGADGKITALHSVLASRKLTAVRFAASTPPAL